MRVDIAHWPDDTVSLFVVMVRIQNFVTGPCLKSWSFFSTPISDPQGTYNATASATVRISFPVRERKEVRIPSPPGGAYNWLPPDVELAYALHPDPTRDIEVEVTSTGDPHFDGTGSYPASNFAEDNNHAPSMYLTLMSNTSVGGPRNFQGMVAAITGASVNVGGVSFNDNGNPKNGFDVTTSKAHCWTTQDSLQLHLLDTAGIAPFSASCSSAPVLAWEYDGQVLAFEDPYPGDPEIYDYARDAVYVAPGGHLSQSFSARQFSWGYNVDGQSGSAYVNEQPSFFKLHLDEDWCVAAGEDPADRRIPLEDDHEWDAIELTRQPELELEPLNDPVNWTWLETDSGEIDYDSSLGALKVSPTVENNGIRKIVDHNLGTYRYLKVDLRTDTDLVPIRLVFGAFFWDVLVDEADTWETKTLDLAAPHNAASFDDVTALQEIEELRFTGLQPEITYWCREMRLERAAADYLRVLPPFQQEGILFHDCDRRPGLDENFRGRSMQNVASAVNDRLDSGFAATAVPSAHPFYNPDAPAAFLRDLIETVLPMPPGGLTLKGLVRADRISPWAGMGNPAGTIGSGILVLQFTKRLRGRIAGLCFIRDLAPPDTLLTRVRVEKVGVPIDTVGTNGQRYYITAETLKAADYEVARLDEQDERGIIRLCQVVNRQLTIMHLRATVWDRLTRQGIADANLAANQSEGCAFGSGASLTNGFYAIVPIYSCLCPPDDHYDLGAKAADYSLSRVTELEVTAPAIVDVDFPLGLAGAIDVTVKDALTQDELSDAHIIAEQAEDPYTGYGTETSSPIYDLDTPSPAGQGTSLYEVIADDETRSSGIAIGQAVDPASSPHEITASLELELGPTGSIVGIVVTDGSTPLSGAPVLAQQTDGVATGIWEAETASDGSYTLEHLDVPGTYVVRLEAAGYERVTEEVILSDSIPEILDLETTLATRIEGVVLGSSEPVSDATLMASDGTDEYWSSSGADGSFVIGPLPGADDYSVTAYAEGWESQTIPSVLVSQGASATADFDLNPDQ